MKLDPHFEEYEGNYNQDFRRIQFDQQSPEKGKQELSKHSLRQFDGCGNYKTKFRVKGGAYEKALNGVNKHKRKVDRESNTTSQYREYKSYNKEDAKR